MAKKKRKRARKSSAPAAKKRRRTKKRRSAATAAPKRRRRRASVKRRRARRASSTRRAAPRRRRRARVGAVTRRRTRRASSHKARRIRVRGYTRRKNPGGLPLWATVGLAGLGGLLSFAVYGAGSFALTQRLDPSMKTLDRNRYIGGAMATVLGGAVALLASPVIGAGLFAGGLIGAVGTDLYLALGKVLDKAPAASTTPSTTPTQQTTKGLYRGEQQQLNGIDGLYRGGDQQLVNGIGGLFRAGDLHQDAWMPTYQ